MQLLRASYLNFLSGLLYVVAMLPVSVAEARS